MFLKHIYQRNKVLLLIILAFLPSVLLALGIYWLVSTLFFEDTDIWSWSAFGWVALAFIGLWLLAAIANADKIFFAGKR